MAEPSSGKWQRVLWAAVASAALSWTAYRSGRLDGALVAGLTYVDDHPVDVAIYAFCAIITLAAFPRRLIRWLRLLWVNHPVVVAALFVALGAGVSAASWVYWSSAAAAAPTLGRPSAAGASVQAGVLVAGAIAAGVGFWFNDQRRRREDSTLKNETDRLNQESVKLDRDKARVEDERFIKVVELLASDNASVRMGALAALESLALSNQARLQEVVNILCIQLRENGSEFFVKSHEDEVASGSSLSRDTVADVSQRLVRQSVQATLIRLIPDISLSDTWMGSDLPAGASISDVRPVLVDLRGAKLENFRLSSKSLYLDLDGAVILGDFRVSRCEFNGDLRLSGASVYGVVAISECNVTGSLSLARTQVADVRISAVRVGDLGRFDFSEASEGGKRSRLQVTGGCDLRRVVWPATIDSFHLMASSIEEVKGWEMEVRHEIVLNRLRFGGALDLRELTVPLGQRHVPLRAVSFEGSLQSPRDCYHVLDERGDHILHLKASARLNVQRPGSITSHENSRPSGGARGSR